MRDYSVLVGIKSDQRRIIDEAFDKGYEQGYKDGTKVNDGERGSVYYGGYGDGLKDGYEKGFKDGQKVKCIEALEAISNIIFVRDATPEESKAVNDYIKSISKETGITWEKEQDQTEKKCN